MKKLFAVLLALTLVLSMGTIALATDGSTTVTTGTITISNAIKDATYSIYKMFDFTPVVGSATNGRYSYASADWQAFVETGAGKDYLAFNDETGTIEWIGAVDADGYPESTAVSALAKAAIAYAEEKGIEATATKTADADGEVTFSSVALGYYAIDTSLGTVCALTNVDSIFTATEKNEKPEIDKEVQEDADSSWGKVNDADIDQTVNYKATVTVAEGAVNYVMHDTMSEGLTFVPDSVKVTVGGAEVTTGFTVNPAPADGCTFEVAFDNDYIATLAAGTEIEVTYSATLNENAVVAGKGNSNKVVLKYGDNNEFETNEKETKTFTWEMDVLKWTDVEGTKTPLAGAKFQLLDKDGNAIKFTDVTVEGGVPTYKVDAEGTVDTITTDENGKFIIVGLDEGTYALHETEAPDGYNKLAGDVAVVITSTHDDATLTAEYDINGKDPATIEVENKTGSLLPETGGIGTQIFYIVGGILMLAALVLLISKKRMANLA